MKYIHQTGSSKVVMSTRLKLLTRNMNVNDVALAVGFKASGSFIRSFKKIVGTTPGQWAAQAESNEQIAL